MISSHTLYIKVLVHQIWGVSGVEIFRVPAFLIDILNLYFGIAIALRYVGIVNDNFASDGDLLHALRIKTLVHL